MRLQCGVVETGDERVLDGTSDRARRHRGLHQRLGTGVVTDQRGVQPFEERLKRLVFRQKSDDDRIGLHETHHVALFDCQLDHPVEQ
jgi:hypothetical protein